MYPLVRASLLPWVCRTGPPAPPAPGDDGTGILRCRPYRPAPPQPIRSLKGQPLELFRLGRSERHVRDERQPSTLMPHDEIHGDRHLAIACHPERNTPVTKVRERQRRQPPYRLRPVLIGLGPLGAALGSSQERVQRLLGQPFLSNSPTKCITNGPKSDSLNAASAVRSDSSSRSRTS